MARRGNSRHPRSRARVRNGHTFEISLRICGVTRVCERKLMGRMNWSRIATRDRMRRHGVEDVKGKMPFVAEPPKPQPRRKLSKGELRSIQRPHSLLGARGRHPKKTSSN